MLDAVLTHGLQHAAWAIWQVAQVLSAGADEGGASSVLYAVVTSDIQPVLNDGARLHLHRVVHVECLVARIVVGIRRLQSDRLFGSCLALHGV